MEMVALQGVQPLGEEACAVTTGAGEVSRLMGILQTSPDACVVLGWMEHWCATAAYFILPVFSSVPKIAVMGFVGQQAPCPCQSSPSPELRAVMGSLFMWRVHGPICV